jgi:hypothetical protein
MKEDEMVGSCNMHGEITKALFHSENLKRKDPVGRPGCRWKDAMRF